MASSTSSSSSFPLIISLPSTAKEEITVRPQTALGSVRSFINRKYGLVPTSQILETADGTKLSDSNKTIEELGIKQGTELKLSVNLEVAKSPRSLEDVRAWSANGVFEWSRLIGVPEDQAKAFLEQNVDGRLFVALEEAIINSDLKVSMLNCRRISLYLRTSRADAAVVEASGRFTALVPRQPVTTIEFDKADVTSFVVPPGLVSRQATEILLYVRVKLDGDTGVTGDGELQLFTKEGQYTFPKYMAVALGNGSAFSSENIWLPLTSNLQLHIAYVGPAASKNIVGEVFLTGFR
eukprot:m.63682 g.63682  ORF g.63682 m.63682 type:complete len:294 (+) comp13870_c0_seq1:49-930(+)